MRKITIFAMLAAVAAAVCSCSLTGEEEEGGSSTGELVLKASSMVIQANGEDEVEFTVSKGGVPVTEDVRFYDGNTNAQIELPSFRFSTSEPGTYTFWAAYGTSHSNVVTVTAIGFPVPDLPADPDQENTSFARKVLLTEFTGTGCGYCPGMITLLRTVLAEEEYSSKTVLAACHTYNPSDPAYLSQGLNEAMGVPSYPALVADMNVLFSNYNYPAGLRSVIDQSYERTEAKAGISARVELDGNTLVVRAAVKAASTSEFRIGAWLLEDGIYGQQSNNYPTVWTGDYNTHDNCIRIADSQVSNTNFTGHSLGTVEAGYTVEYPFVMTLDDSWDADNCHVVVFVTTPESGRYLVNNVIDCPVGEEVAFQYE